MKINDPGKIARRPRLSEEICAAIEKSIASGELITGQKLPAEKSLAEAFGVSRTVIHEALACLRANGRIETIAGSGTVVALAAKTLNFRFRQGEAHALAELREIFELRATIEISIADLAARRRTDEDISAMQAHLVAMEKTLHCGTDGSTAEDNFHRAVTTATRNSYTCRLFEFLGPHFSDSRRTDWSGPEDDSAQRREKHAEHLAVFTAISAGDPVLARRAANEHLHRSAHRAGIALGEFSDTPVETHHAAFTGNTDRIFGRETTFENRLGQRVLEL